MGATTTKCLLLLSLLFVTSHAQETLAAPLDCGNLMYDAVEFSSLEFNQTSRNYSIERFCQQQALAIRQEHFWCGGYVDEYNNVIDGTARFNLPTDSSEFWTIFLQYPALSWMDVARKASVITTIRNIAVTQSECSTGIPVVENLCVSNVETHDVSGYFESVLVTVYNLGSVSGETFNTCFQSGLAQQLRLEESDLVTRFRGKAALNLTINTTLLEMFQQNIGPASSIGDINRDPTMRPVVLGSWAENITLDEAIEFADKNSRFATNPNPINYGLEAGDIVFAVFGSFLLLGVGILVVLGFFIHPFYLS